MVYMEGRGHALPCKSTPFGTALTYKALQGKPRHSIYLAKSGLAEAGNAKRLQLQFPGCLVGVCTSNKGRSEIRYAMLRVNTATSESPSRRAPGTNSENAGG